MPARRRYRPSVAPITIIGIARHARPHGVRDARAALKRSGRSGDGGPASDFTLRRNRHLIVGDHALQRGKHFFGFHLRQDPAIHRRAGRLRQRIESVAAVQHRRHAGGPQRGVNCGEPGGEFLHGVFGALCRRPHQGGRRLRLNLGHLFQKRSRDFVGVRRKLVFREPDQRFGQPVDGVVGNGQ